VHEDRDLAVGDFHAAAKLAQIGFKFGLRAPGNRVFKQEPQTDAGDLKCYGDEDRPDDQQAHSDR